MNGDGKNDKKDKKSTSPKATGPRTPLGKQRSRMNASKHGRYSRMPLLVDKFFGEREQDLRDLQRTLQEQYKPRTAGRELAVRDYAVTLVRLERIKKLETLVLESSLLFPLGRVPVSIAEGMVALFEQRNKVYGVPLPENWEEGKEEMLSKAREKGQDAIMEDLERKLASGEAFQKLLWGLGALEGVFRCEAHLRRILAKLEGELSPHN